MVSRAINQELPTVVRSFNIVPTFNQIFSLDCLMSQQRGVTQIMRHHDRWVEGGKVESRDR